MNFDGYGNDRQFLRMNIAIKLYQSMIAHHGHFARCEESVEEAYKGADEILKQGHPEFASKGNEDPSWRRKPDINNYKSYGDNII
jgi:hypothetical protein